MRLIKPVLFTLVAPVLAGCIGYTFKVAEPASVVHVKQSKLYSHIRELAEEVERQGVPFPLVHSADYGYNEDGHLSHGVRPESDDDSLRVLEEHQCSALESVAGFIHLSDIQIKEPTVNFTRLFRWVGGADRDPELERFGYATFLSTVLSINALAANPERGGGYCGTPASPGFTIHTGDSIDAGMFSELFLFLSVINKLELPFYNVIGNHDDIFFGTLPADKISGYHVVSPFVPIGDASRFIRAHNPESVLSDFTIPYLNQEEHDTTLLGAKNFADQHSVLRSQFHGFDAACEQADLSGFCPEAERGYYEFVYKPIGHPDFLIQIIVINTFEARPRSLVESVSRSSKGKITEKQLSWLKRALGKPLCSPGECKAVSLVFGHHPFGSFLDDASDGLQDLLESSSRVKAYVTGHKHDHEVRVHPRQGGESSGPPLWEIIGGANIEYPQFGVHVEILKNTNESDLGYIRLRSFEQRIWEQGSGCEASSFDDDLACQSNTGRNAAKRAVGSEEEADQKYSGGVKQANGLLRITL